MNSTLCDLLEIEFPLFAFSHCRDVVAAVSNAGGFGVLGAVGHTPKTLETELNWIDKQVNGKPYGVDLLIPNKIDSKGTNPTPDEIEARIPAVHKIYIRDLLVQHGLDVEDLWQQTVADRYGENLREAKASSILDVAFAHPIKMIVNALGDPPDFMIERAKNIGVTVGALTGAKEHAIKHVEAGVDILIVSGIEAGGHCGEVFTLVLVPVVLQAIEHYEDVHALAAGGIATGRQMAACMAMGADGVWTGSVWLTTAEAETTSTIKEKNVSSKFA